MKYMRCIIPLILWAALVLVADAALAQHPDQVREKHNTSDFVNVQKKIDQLLNRYRPQEVLLVVDIDNTLLAMNQEMK